MSNPTNTPRKIKTVHRAQRADMAGLPTVRPMPTAQLEHIDPFIFLNHHGPKHYEPNNSGLPFSPHPHRGMQTVTFVVDGDVLHRDNAGGTDTIRAGGVQWMVAGKGLLHEEVSSEDFKREGGDMEILQLWVNLPREHKMVDPAYYGLSADDITTVEEDDGSARVRVVAGSWGETTGPYDPLTDVEMYWLELDEGASLETNIEATKNIFFYVVQGQITVNDQDVSAMHLVEFENSGDLLQIEAQKPSLVLLGHATPFEEPIVAGGPFVMNSEEEIAQAYRDMRSGKFGTW